MYQRLFPWLSPYACYYWKGDGGGRKTVMDHAAAVIADAQPERY